MLTSCICWCSNYIVHQGLHIVSSYFQGVALHIITSPIPLQADPDLKHEW